MLVPQPECSVERLCELLSGFAANRELLMKLAHNARHLAVTDAADTVAGLCLGLADA